jgi:hypothetical protein
MAGETPRCWICGGEATTREHKTKRSDLKSAFGVPTQSQPLYYHDARRQNQLIRSLNADILKSPSRICADCNNARTQPHDLAWDFMSVWLRERNPKMRVGDVIRANRIFPSGTTEEMKNVHLFFLKQFGGLILESAGQIAIDVKPFANAIINGRPHPNVYLQFGIGPFVNGKPVTGRSDFKGLRLASGACVLGMWFYQVDGLTVTLIYADPNEPWRNLHLAWHPLRNRNRFVLADYASGVEAAEILDDDAEQAPFYSAITSTYRFLVSSFRARQSFQDVET